jgi:hypothetical protein
MIEAANDPVMLHEPRPPRRGTAMLRRYRAAWVALTVSIAVHAVVVAGLPHVETVDRQLVRAYTATLDPAAVIVPAPAPLAGPAPAAAPRVARAKSRPRAPAAPPLLETLPGTELAALAMAPAQAGETSGSTSSGSAPVEAAELEPAPAKPEMLALAQPAAPIPALEPPRFPAEAFPAALSIDYQLTSAVADGRASYEWQREGDSYRISGEAEATGFFTLFLEGRVLQESRGTVTATGLRPDRFREKKPQGAEEGLEFDWAANQVTFDRGSERRTTPLAGNTVDWLSMIFQLAHVPPAARSVDLEVFTQRKMYKFTLRVLGTEEIEIPMGRVKALHLQHAGNDAKEAVDVWLGVDYHHLPVKMRYPVARNRLMVEQFATRVGTR